MAQAGDHVDRSHDGVRYHLWITSHMVNERFIRPTARCHRCGYDLRGQTVERCPECGRAFDANDPTTYTVTKYRGGIDLVLTLVVAFSMTIPGIACAVANVGVDIRLLGLRGSEIWSFLAAMGMLAHTAVFCHAVTVVRHPPALVEGRQAALWATLLSGVMGPGLLVLGVVIMAVRLSLGLPV